MNYADYKFRAILKQYKKPVYRQALRILGDVQDAEELTQDVFLNVYYGLELLREEERIDAWIYRITANACLSRRRKAAERYVSLEEAELDGQIMAPNPGPNPEEEYLQQEERIQLLRHVSVLPRKEAIAITLCHYEDKSYNEISSIMQVPPGTVAALLYRGRLHLHALLVSEKKKETDK